MLNPIENDAIRTILTVNGTDSSLPNSTNITRAPAAITPITIKIHAKTTKDIVN